MSHNVDDVRIIPDAINGDRHTVRVYVGDKFYKKMSFYYVGISMQQLQKNIWDVVLEELKTINQHQPNCNTIH